MANEKERNEEGQGRGRQGGVGGEGRQAKQISWRCHHSPPGSSATASKFENIRDCPWLCPFNSTDLQDEVAEDRGRLCGKSFGVEGVRGGRDAATLGQSFWGQSSGGPHVFGSYLPHLRWPHMDFDSYRFRQQPKGGLASMRWGQGEGHPATSIGKRFPRI